MDSANEFEKKYIHLSSNTYPYELLCFQRWFIILDFATRHQIENFLHIDSDVLLYCNVNNVFGKYIGSDFTTCGESGPMASLFSITSLQRFCDFITGLYDEGAKNRLYDFYKSYVEKKGIGGVCDMVAFSWYQKDMPSKVTDIAIPDGGSCFDINISLSYGFEMQRGLKKIYWKNNLPYGKLLSDGSFVQFYSLHFQGRAKYSIYRYALDKNKVHRTDLMYTLKWMFSKAIIKARLQGIIKVIRNPRILSNFIKKKIQEIKR